MEIKCRMKWQWCSFSPVNWAEHIAVLLQLFCQSVPYLNKSIVQHLSIYPDLNRVVNPVESTASKIRLHPDCVFWKVKAERWVELKIVEVERYAPVRLLSSWDKQILRFANGLVSEEFHRNNPGKGRVLFTDLAHYQVGRSLESLDSPPATLAPARYLSCLKHLLHTMSRRCCL